MDLRNKTLLVIAPHPDDDVAGCGGLIARVKEQGGRVYLVVMTLGDAPQYGGSSVAHVRMDELRAVQEYLGIDGIDVLFPGEDYHLKLDHLPQKTLIDAIEQKGKFALNTVKPDIVAVPAKGSYHQDHEATFTAAFTACRPRPGDMKPFSPAFIAYEGPYLCWTHEAAFTPNLFVDISSQIKKKMGAMALYKSQLRPRLHPFSEENIERYAAMRGRSVGVEFAEAFVLYRDLI